MHGLMKNIGIAGMLVAMIASASILSGCGNTEESAAPGQKKITAVTNAVWNPFEYLDQGQVVGFDIDLFNEAAKEAGYDGEIQNVGWEAAFQLVKDKSADAAISGITITDERKQTYDFSVPYFVSKEVLLVPADSPITSVADLNGKTVAVQNASTAQKQIEKVLGTNHEGLKKTTKSMRDQMLLTGQVDAIAGDEVALMQMMKEHPEQQFKIVYDDTAFAPEYFGIMYAKGGNKEVQDNLNKALKKMVASGKYAEIYKKWFQKDPDMKALKEALQES